MSTEGLKVRHAWGYPDESLPRETVVLRIFAHAKPDRGTVTLEQSPDGKHWVRAQSYSYRPDDECVVEMLATIALEQGRNWGTVASAQCCFKSHDCGHCGYPTWIESHGNAAGHCARCWYHG